MFDYRNETAMLHIFFKDEHIIQFKRDRLYTIEDFVCKSLLYFQMKHLTQQYYSNLYHVYFHNYSNHFVANIGGLLGLWLGFSLLSVLELIYFFTCRWFVLACRNRLVTIWYYELAIILYKKSSMDVSTYSIEIS